MYWNANIYKTNILVEVICGSFRETKEIVTELEVR